MRTRIFAVLCAAALIAGAGSARANGVFPAAGQVVVDPSDPAHIVVRTTYGLLLTRAAGPPWDWLCETAVGYSSGFHPSVAVTEDGSVIAGLPDGIGVAHADACAWSHAPGASDGSLIIDVALDKQTPSRAVAVSAPAAGGGAKLWITDDNAVTWTQAGVDLPAGYTPLTVDLAPSDPSRIYVSALVSGGGTFKGALLASDDGGQKWYQFTVPMTDGDHGPYIGAVDPTNPDRVYVRTDGLPGRLFAFDFSAVMFTELHVAIGYLKGFALSPDGSTMLTGGSSDGILRSPTDIPAFEKISNVQTRCLTWTSAGVYTCATETIEGFSVGLSKDQGKTFEPVMHLPCVRGVLACDASTSVGKACPGEWSTVAAQIGKDTCPDGVTPISSGGAGGAGGAAGAGAGGASSTSAGGSAGAGGSSAGGASGCSCAIEDRTGERGAALATAALMLLAYRRRPRRGNARA